jgi:hypothetical protein
MQQPPARQLLAPKHAADDATLCRRLHMRNRTVSKARHAATLWGLACCVTDSLHDPRCSVSRINSRRQQDCDIRHATTLQQHLLAPPAASSRAANDTPVALQCQTHNTIHQATRYDVRNRHASLTLIGHSRQPHSYTIVPFTPTSRSNSTPTAAGHLLSTEMHTYDVRARRRQPASKAKAAAAG